MIGIYKITSPTNRVYIGQSVDIKSRLTQYKRLDCKNQPKLYNSLKKYGFKSHIFEVIHYCDIEELNELERYYQDLYDVLNKGLNLKLTETSDKSGKLSEETKRKISLIHKGRRLTDETKRKMSKTRKGRKFSEQHKINKSIAQLGGKNPAAKIVLDTNTGVFYETLNDAYKSHNFPYHIKSLGKRLNNKIKNNTSLIYV